MNTDTKPATYEPIGSTTVTGSNGNPYQFTCRENDGTGLYFYRARYYNPTFGTFISQDPGLHPNFPPIISRDRWLFRPPGAELCGSV
jgi:RHS repeat-associated protein